MCNTLCLGIIIRKCPCFFKKISCRQICCAWVNFFFCASFFSYSKWYCLDLCPLLKSSIICFANRYQCFSQLHWNPALIQKNACWQLFACEIIISCFSHAVLVTKLSFSAENIHWSNLQRNRYFFCSPRAFTQYISDIYHF